MVMKPTNEKTIFRIKLRTNANLNGVNLNSQIILKTNVTDIVIPLLSYKGKLKLVSLTCITRDNCIIILYF